MENDMVEYWIWLQRALGANSPKPERLLEQFGGIGDVYEARRVELMSTGFLTEKEIRRLSDKSLEKSKEIVSECMRHGYTMLTLENMPQRLRNIYAPPCVLYVWGELPQPTDGVYVAMVGTRGVTPYGVEAATKLAVGLAHCGAVVVSGLAVGVDAASHKGALKGGGKTVAVIGCGIDIDYPAPHVELKRLIAQNGAVVSEYPPGARPDRINFPVRNRIIAGLSLGCVVVEAGSRSGALITASLAAEMGRDIFAVPGSIFSSVSDGPNRLLRDGAKPVCNVVDILEEYIGVCPQSIISKMADLDTSAGGQLTFDSIAATGGTQRMACEKDQSDKLQKSSSTQVQTTTPDGAQAQTQPITQIIQTQTKPDTINLPDATPNNKPSSQPGVNCPGAAGVNCPTAGGGLSEKQRLVYETLSGEPQHVDEISLKANLPLRTVLAVLTTLEIEGFVQSFPGRRYTVLT